MLNGFGKQIKRKRRKQRKLRAVKSVELTLPSIDFAPSTNVVPIKSGKTPPKINSMLLARVKARRSRRLDGPISNEQTNPFVVYQPPPGVLPAGVKAMAMDDASTQQVINWAVPVANTYFREGLTFPGYAYLSELTLRPEYRVISQVIATEMTRKWIKFKSRAEKEAEDVAEGMNAEEGAEGEQVTQQLEDEDAEPLDADTAEEEEYAKDADPDAANQLVEMQVAQQQKKEQEHEFQQAESEQRAAEMADVDDKAEKIKELEAEFKRLCVRDVFFKLIEMDGWFGRVHLYVDLQDPASEISYTDDRAELMTDIGDGQDEVTKAKVTKGSLKRLSVIEPVWTYPQHYDSRDPLKEEFYNPSTWFVMGKQLHASRLMTYVSRPVPDILKPAYAFGGLSLSQIAKPYIDNWLQTRQSVNDIIHAFSVMVLMTDLGSRLQASDSTGVPGDGSSLMDRVDLFNAFRDNLGTFVIDKEGEDFKNVTVPLSNLDSLQAQAQEHMASISRIPLVKLLGISPHGLNATAEPELKAFNDTIHAEQEAHVRPLLTKVMHFAMINLWGEVDEEIDFEFEHLTDLDEKAMAELRKMDAETDDILVNGCNAIHPEEVRKRLANDPDSLYDDIDLSDIPDKPMDDPGAINIHGTEPFAKGAQGEEQQTGEELDGDKSPNPFGGDAEFRESDHPRKDNGEFGSGGGSGKKREMMAGSKIPRATREELSDLRMAIRNHGSDKGFESYPKEVVNLGNILSTQEGVDKATIEKYMREGHEGNVPFVIEHKGNYYLEDGHHRVAAIQAAGGKSFKAHVYHLKSRRR
jgi:phage-related protein (TIGR01555 family)